VNVLDRGAGRLVLPLGVALVVLAILGPSVMPGLGLWDTGEFQTVPPILGTMHPTGYPTYVLLGFVVNLLLTPIGEPAYRMNVMSLLAVVAAAVLAALTIRMLTGRTLIAAAAGIGLALTPISWAIATRADAHALHLAFVALLLALLGRWEHARAAAEDPPDAARRGDRWLLAAAVVYGLAAGNHSLTLLLALPILLYVLAVEPEILRRPRFLASCALAAIGTLALVYLELPLRAGPFRAPLVYGHPETLEGFLYVVLAEQFRGSFTDPLADPLGSLLGLGVLLWDQLGPLLLLVPLGWVATWRILPGYALLSGLATTITVLFAVAYDNADIRRYYLVPMLFAWTWLAVLAAWVVRRLTRPRASAIPDGWSPAEPATRSPKPEDTGGAAIRPGLVGALRRTPRSSWVALAMAAALLVPAATGWDARRAYADRSNDHAGRDWLRDAFATLRPDAVVVSWWSYSTALWYAQLIDGQRPDLLVIDDRTRLDEGLGDVTDVIDAHLGQRPVYVIPTDVDLVSLAARYELVPVGDPSNLFFVRGRLP